MTDYPAGEEAQHLLFNKVVHDAAQHAQVAARQLFSERFNAVMGYHPQVTDEELSRDSIAFFPPRTFYKVGGYWLAADEYEGTAFLMLRGRQGSFESPAEFAEYLRPYKEQ